MRIIAGLGNPGEKYKITRHNVGFMALNALAQKYKLTWKANKKFQAEIAKYEDAILIKPQTFMNNSGRTVQAALSYYKLLPKKFGLLTAKNSDLSEILTVIHDDIDIELGQYKVSIDSGSAGHKGIDSIINYLKTKNFKRIRIGINNNKPAQMPTDKYVLQKFNEKELAKINQIIENINI